MATYKPIPDETAELLARFMAKVDKGPHCWLWLGTTQNGYGITRIGGRSLRAHRVAYHWLVGSLDESLTIDHRCRVRNCVRPDHLEAVTLAENGRRGLMASHPGRAALRAWLQAREQTRLTVTDVPLPVKDGRARRRRRGGSRVALVPNGASEVTKPRA